jgi:hypothetical protein
MQPHRKRVRLWWVVVPASLTALAALAQLLQVLVSLAH